MPPERSWSLDHLPTGLDRGTRRAVGAAVAHVVRPRRERLVAHVSCHARDEHVEPVVVQRRLRLDLDLSAHLLAQLQKLGATRRAGMVLAERALAHRELIDTQLRLIRQILVTRWVLARLE